jgi:peptidyl-prolyl cis-trans isomerase B (cyclophilin B)
MRCVPFLVALLSAPVLMISVPIRVSLESVPIRVSLESAPIRVSWESAPIRVPWESAPIRVPLISAPTRVPLISAPIRVSQTSPGAGPVIVLETVKGVIEFETYPEEAPKTVAQIVGLVKRGFYNGQRFHRAEPNFVVQIGDPQSRNMTLQEWWGRSGSGKPIGVAEITKKRTHLRGAIGMGHSGSAKDADSQFYITLRNAPELNGKYTVFGQVIKGMEVAAKLQKADVLKKASVKE